MTKIPHRYYLDDFPVGSVIETAGATMTEGEIIDFALKFDPQPFHIDTEAAKDSIFGALIASGFHTLSIAFRLFTGTGVLAAASLGGPGMDQVRWLKPVFAGDTVRVRVTVAENRPSRSKPDRGSIIWDFAVSNQRGETVLTASMTSMLSRRPAE